MTGRLQASSSPLSRQPQPPATPQHQSILRVAARLCLCPQPGRVSGPQPPGSALTSPAAALRFPSLTIPDPAFTLDAPQGAAQGVQPRARAAGWVPPACQAAAASPRRRSSLHDGKPRIPRVPPRLLHGSTPPFPACHGERGPPLPTGPRSEGTAAISRRCWVGNESPFVPSPPDPLFCDKIPSSAPARLRQSSTHPSPPVLPLASEGPSPRDGRARR